jgi:hypothetical protein
MQHRMRANVAFGARIFPKVAGNVVFVLALGTAIDANSRIQIRADSRNSRANPFFE